MELTFVSYMMLGFYRILLTSQFPVETVPSAREMSVFDSVSGIINESARSELTVNGDYVDTTDFPEPPGAGSVNVKFDIENCKCKGIELGNRGGGPRTLRVSCQEGKSSLTCDYKGNPHKCNKYTNSKTGPTTFYGQALKVAARRICGQRAPWDCPQGEIVTALCGEKAVLAYAP